MAFDLISDEAKEQQQQQKPHPSNQEFCIKWISVFLTKRKNFARSPAAKENLFEFQGGDGHLIDSSQWENNFDPIHFKIQKRVVVSES